MYEEFFDMINTPFVRNIPSGFQYEPFRMTDVLGRLSYAADRQLFAVLTADAGCGKSTIIRKFKESLPAEDYIFLYLSDSKLTPRWFYKGLLDQLGIESKFYGKNFVFDERLGESVDGQIISHCHQCGKPADTHTNCANNDCHLLFIQCAECREKFSGCCSDECKIIYNLPEDEKLKARVENAHRYAESRIFKSRLRPRLQKM